MMNKCGRPGNRIVHDYMNVDMQLVADLVIQDKHHFIGDFLLRPIEESGTSEGPA